MFLASSLHDLVCDRILFAGSLHDLFLPCSWWILVACSMHGLFLPCTGILLACSMHDIDLIKNC